jgi:redox-sensing transcriptional repressor
VALVDTDASKVGEKVGETPVRHLDDLEALVKEHQVAIGVLATPSGAAQEVADRMVSAGIGSVLNFAPAVVTVPEGVSIRKVDLASELLILSFYQQRRDGGVADLTG